MAERMKIVIDAGHGGVEPGAVYSGRQEKDDNLRMAFAVGYLLEQAGMTVLYTRVDDVYDTPYEKAQMANRAGADYFISIHRNSVAEPNTASGFLSLVYADRGVPATMARNINAEVAGQGLADLGVAERPGLVVLNSTQMPAVLLEVGFINNDYDNQVFDNNFYGIAQAIADGILKTIRGPEEMPRAYYQVQVVAYQNREMAQRLVTQLQSEGFPAFMVYEDGYYKVRVGAFSVLDNAARMEQQLRNSGYSTFIVREQEIS